MLLRDVKNFYLRGYSQKGLYFELTYGIKRFQDVRTLLF